MYPHRILLAASLLVPPACTTTHPVYAPQERDPWGPPPGLDGPLISGIFGVTELTALDLSLDPDLGETRTDDELSLAMIGAAMQSQVHRRNLTWGFEAGFTVGWDTDRDGVAVDTGTVVVRSDNRLRVADLSGGVYVGKTLGERLRVYAGAGPLFQFAHVDLEFDQDLDGEDHFEDDGIGLGYYTRVGVEYVATPATMVGVLVRWVDSEVDMGSRIDDLDIEALQVGVVVTTGF